MKVSNAAIALLCFLAVVPLRGSFSEAAAQEAGDLTILVIDTEAIYRESSALKQLQSEIVAQQEAFKQELRAREEALRADGQQLAKQQSILSARALSERRKELETRAAVLQRQVRDRKAELDKQWSEGMRGVRDALIAVTQEIAAGRNADLVIEKSAIVLVKPQFDITGEARTLLNQRLPTVPASAPGQ